MSIKKRLKIYSLMLLLCTLCVVMGYQHIKNIRHRTDLEEKRYNFLLQQLEVILEKKRKIEEANFYKALPGQVKKFYQLTENELNDASWLKRICSNSPVFFQQAEEALIKYNLYEECAGSLVNSNPRTFMLINRDYVADKTYLKLLKKYFSYGFSPLPLQLTRGELEDNLEFYLNHGGSLPTIRAFLKLDEEKFSEWLSKELDKCLVDNKKIEKQLLIKKASKNFKMAALIISNKKYFESKPEILAKWVNNPEGLTQEERYNLSISNHIWFEYYTKWLTLEDYRYKRAVDHFIDLHSVFPLYASFYLYDSHDDVKLSLAKGFAKKTFRFPETFSTYVSANPEASFIEKGGRLIQLSHLKALGDPNNHYLNHNARSFVEQLLKNEMYKLGYGAQNVKPFLNFIMAYKPFEFMQNFLCFNREAQEALLKEYHHNLADKALVRFASISPYHLKIYRRELKKRELYVTAAKIMFSACSTLKYVDETRFESVEYERMVLNLFNNGKLEEARYVPNNILVKEPLLSTFLKKGGNYQHLNYRILKVELDSSSTKKYDESTTIALAMVKHHFKNKLKQQHVNVFLSQYVSKKIPNIFDRINNMKHSEVVEVLDYHLNSQKYQNKYKIIIFHSGEKQKVMPRQSLSFFQKLGLTLIYFHVRTPDEVLEHQQSLLAGEKGKVLGILYELHGNSDLISFAKGHIIRDRDEQLLLDIAKTSRELLCDKSEAFIALSSCSIAGTKIMGNKVFAHWFADAFKKVEQKRKYPIHISASHKAVSEMPKIKMYRLGKEVKKISYPLPKGGYQFKITQYQSITNNPSTWTSKVK